jgi:hypothetical protein
MATILPKFRVKYGEGVGVELFVALPDLTDNEKTYLDADEAAGQTALSANGTNFSVGEYVLLGTPMGERSEIVRIHAATAPTSSTITTASATTFAHSRGEPVVFVPYNQIVVERSTDSGVSYTPLSAVNIRSDSSETYIQRASDASTDYYKFRFYNSSDATYSAYSDAIIATGPTSGTVGAVKRRALIDLGEQMGGYITDEFLNESINEARREVDNDVRVGKFSFRTSFNTDIGDCIPGRWLIACPTDLRDRNTYKNILELHVGRDGRSLQYLDFNRLMDRYRDVAHSTLSSQITAVSTSIVLASSGDFDESGSVTVAAESISGVLDTADYTTNTESTSTLGTVTNISATHAAGRDVWQGATFGKPSYFTIYEGNIYFDVPLEDDLAGENIFCSYYKVLSDVNSDGDSFDEPEFDLFVSYLKAKIKYRKANGDFKIEEDSDYKDFKRKKDDLVNKEITGQDVRFTPDDWYA